MLISDWSSDVCSSDLPLGREFGVDREEMLLAARDIVLWIDRAYRAFGHPQGAVDAAFRVDDEEIRALVEAVHRAHLHAIGVLAVDAVFGDAVGHGARGELGSASCRERVGQHGYVSGGA